MVNKENFKLYSKEEKITIINDFFDNYLGYRQGAQKYGISKTTLLYWVLYRFEFFPSSLVLRLAAPTALEPTIDTIKAPISLTTPPILPAITEKTLLITP